MSKVLFLAVLLAFTAAALAFTTSTPVFVVLFEVVEDVPILNPRSLKPWLVTLRTRTIPRETSPYYWYRSIGEIYRLWHQTTRGSVHQTTRGF